MGDMFQRDALFDRLYDIARNDQNVIIVAVDMSAPMLDKYRKDIPNQFVNVGIAEQNSILIGSGLAKEGKKVFVYSIASFQTLRCLEQIRVENGINEIPITILGMGTGLSYCFDGPTHHLVEDISVLRTFPHITLHTLTDSAMAASFADISYRWKDGTNYVRIDKDIYPNLYDDKTDFSRGMIRVRPGERNIILTAGPMVHTALKAAGAPSLKDLDVGVVDLFQIPIQQKEFLQVIRNAARLLTLEEHFLPGGLGSAVCEFLQDNGIAIPVKRMGIRHEQAYAGHYTYGGRNVMWKHFGIDADSVEAQARSFFSAETSKSPAARTAAP